MKSLKVFALPVVYIAFLPDYYVDKSDKDRCRLWSSNGRIIFASSQSYSSKQKTKENLQDVRNELNRLHDLGVI